MVTMIKYFTEKLFKKFFGFNVQLFSVIVVFTLYSSYKFGFFANEGCTLFEYILLGISDHYYFTFFFLLIYAINVVRVIKDNDDLVLLRCRRYLFYCVSKLLAITLFTISYILLHIIILAVTGLLKCNVSNTFSGIFPMYASISEVGLTYQSAFQTPLEGIIVMALYMSLALCVFSSILILAAHFLSEKIVIQISVATYILIVVTLNSNVDGYAPLLFPNNYLIFHRALDFGLEFHMASISAGMLIICLFIANQQRKNFLHKIFSFALSPMRTFGGIISLKGCIVLLFTTFALSLLNVIKFSSKLLSGSEHVVMLFWGYGVGYLNLIDFLQIVIINGIPIYILSIFLGNKSSMRDIVMIRYRQRGIWFANVQFSMIIVICLQLVIMSIFTLLMGNVDVHVNDVLAGTINFPYNIDSLRIICIGLLLRVFEIMFMQMIFFLVLSLLKNITAAFLLTMSLYLSVVILDMPWNPFGMSSLCRVVWMNKESADLGFMVPVSIFAVLYILMYMYMQNCGINQILNQERK